MLANITFILIFRYSKKKEVKKIWGNLTAKELTNNKQLIFLKPKALRSR